MPDRARITLPDLVFVLFSLAILGALGPVFLTSLADRADEFGTLTLYALRILVPLAVLIILYSVYQKAVQGGTAR
jgi:hypothetical protein